MIKAIVHGTRYGYTRGCRCRPCTDAKSASQYDYLRRRKEGLLDTPPCTSPDCPRPSMVRTLCAMHYKRWLRANGMDQSPSAAWSDKRRDNYHARRARMNGARNSSPALLAALIERDGLNCGGCNEAIDPTLAWPHRMSKSIDHKIPLARGGEHSLDNTQLMHFACNASKGTRTSELMFEAEA